MPYPRAHDVGEACPTTQREFSNDSVSLNLQRHSAIVVDPGLDVRNAAHLLAHSSVAPTAFEYRPRLHQAHGVDGSES